MTEPRDWAEWFRNDAAKEHARAVAGYERLKSTLCYCDRIGGAHPKSDHIPVVGFDEKGEKR